MPYDCPEENACKSIKDGECPLEADKTYTYEIGMEISDSYPAVLCTIKIFIDGFKAIYLFHRSRLLESGYSRIRMMKKWYVSNLHWKSRKNKRRNCNSFSALPDNSCVEKTT